MEKKKESSLNLLLEFDFKSQSIRWYSWSNPGLVLLGYNRLKKLKSIEGGFYL